MTMHTTITTGHSARPRVMVVGKYRSIVHWAENVSSAFRQNGCEVAQFAINGQTVWHSLRYKFAGNEYGSQALPVRADFERALQRFKPDLVVFIVIAALWMPEELFALARQTRPGAATAVWIGDRLNAEECRFAHHVDQVFATDSAFIDDLRHYGHALPAHYLPLAVDPQRFHPFSLARSQRLVYVANNSPGRGELIRQVREPLVLYGKGWSKLADTAHDIHARRLPYRDLPRVYASHRAVLNIRNEKNVLHGLNQRSFEPYGCMTPVLNDDMADLPRCFEPGKEILVWHSLAELEDLQSRLQRDSGFAQAIGLAGHRRVLAEHTWQHRIHSLLTAFDFQDVRS